jgi:hypothetical protein
MPREFVLPESVGVTLVNTRQTRLRMASTSSNLRHLLAAPDAQRSPCVPQLIQSASDVHCE